MSTIPRVLAALIAALSVASLCIAQNAAQPAPPEVPRIDSVVMASVQPQAGDKATIWYDDFDGPAKVYAEGSGGLDDAQAFGGAGKSMLCLYEKGRRGTGGRKVFFGDTPAYRNKAVRVGETFGDVYWRIYVKHQKGWTGGGPAKLSRATSLASENWTQAMIAHVWSSGEALTLDPASGVRDGKVVTTKYNDFANLRWLGNKPVSAFKLSSAEESGRWVCVEARARLNTPGKKDGLMQLWIDGRLESERQNLDWRGTYTKHGINAVFLEAYWNDGSPVTQSRWIDNFVIATQPIGPVTAPRTPVLIKTPYAAGGTQKAWEAEVAVMPAEAAKEIAAKDGAAPAAPTIVWQSAPQTGSDRVTIDAAHGRFTGPLAGKTELAPAATYHCRVRQQSDSGTWSPWSPWHQPFVTAR